MPRNRTVLLALLLSTALSGAAAADVAPPRPPEKKLTVRYTVPGEGAERDTRVAETVAALRARLVAFGVRGGRVWAGDAGEVRAVASERPGLEEVLTRPGDLAFHLVDDAEATRSGLRPLPEGVREEAWHGAAGLPADLVAERAEQLAPLATRLPAGRILGVGPDVAPDSPALHWEAVVLESTPALANDAVRTAEAQALAGGKEQGVVLTLSDEAARQLEQVTTTHVGRRLAILVDGVVEHVPTLREPIRGGAVQLTRCEWRGRRDARDLARAYAAALAAPLPGGVSVVGTERGR
jgi:preprotein translocase subunit SecD